MSLLLDKDIAEREIKLIFKDILVVVVILKWQRTVCIVIQAVGIT